MPPLPNVPGVIRFNIHWAIDGDTMGQSVHYFQFSGGSPDGPDMQAFCALAVSSGQTAFGGLCNTHVGMNLAMGTDLTSNSATQATGGTPWVGTRSGGMLSPGTAAVVSHSIARRYRGGKPRTYLPVGVSTDLATTGLWTTGFQTAVDSGWGTWTAALQGATAGSVTLTKIINVGYYSGYTLGPAQPGGYRKKIPTPLATPHQDVFIGHTVNIAVGSQRRRNRAA